MGCVFIDRKTFAEILLELDVAGEDRGGADVLARIFHSFSTAMAEQVAMYRTLRTRLLPALLIRVRLRTLVPDSNCRGERPAKALN
jgi:hypothetical protein